MKVRLINIFNIKLCCIPNVVNLSAQTKECEPKYVTYEHKLKCTN